MLLLIIIAVGVTLSESNAGEVIFDFDSVALPEYEYFYDENGQKQKVKWQTCFQYNTLLKYYLIVASIL